ncbi:metallopeptidase family protein [Mariprofundus erugo]|uniref:metallopeptidase family protein n=1 Tax=Mariprofundus erugo TaxID=2528639 RepID=UPI001EE95065|nr:metallopeptidase family protein [Mariprofundus erugo]
MASAETPLHYMMDTETFRMLAEQAFNELPEPFRLVMENVVIVVDDYADAEVLASMGLTSPLDLLGLYEGHPLEERTDGGAGMLPDMIHLYRVPILASCHETGEEPADCIAAVVMHEVGHYFGFSDEEMEEIDMAGEDD